MLQQLNQPRTVKVLRSFFYQGKVVEKDSTVKLPAHSAAGVGAGNKCASGAARAPPAPPRDVDAAKPAAKKGG